MKLRFILITLGLLTFNLNAQDSDWAIEANFNPFFLGALNSDDQTVKSDGLSGGYGLGISLKYNAFDPIQIEGGLQYLKQNYNGIDQCCVEEGSDYRVELSYIKIPLIFNYGWDWDYKNDTRLTLGLGGQLLILNDYSLRIEDRLAIVTIENGQRTLYIKDENIIESIIEDDFFSKNRLGLLAQFGLEKSISDSFTYSIKLRTEYDLSLIDNDNAFNYDLSYFRIGLQFGIQYNFQKTAGTYVKGIL